MPRKTKKAVGEGGSGSALDLTVEKDRALVRRAVKERWPMPMAKREKLTAKLLNVALDKKSDTRAVASVARTLAAMDKLNQLDEHAERHYERIDNGEATEFVGGVILVDDLAAKPK